MRNSNLRLTFRELSDMGHFAIVGTTDKPTRPQWNGSVLKALRESRDMEPRDLAAVVGAHKSQVYKWEEGENTPGADYLAAFSVLFGVAPMTFFVGVDAYQAFVVRQQTEAPLEKAAAELEDMASSPLPGRRMRAVLNVDRREKSDAARQRSAHDPGEQPRTPQANPSQTSKHED